MLKAENCTYDDQYIELYQGGIAIDLDNKAIFVTFDNDHQMFDGLTSDIEVTLSHKPQNMNVRHNNCILSSVIKSTTLIVKQGDVTYQKNIDDVAIAPFLKGVELAGYEWCVEKDLSARSFVIAANK